MTSNTSSTFLPNLERSGAVDEKKSDSPTDFASYAVILEDEDDPQNLSTVRKWITVAVISSASLCAACTSSVASFTELGIAAEFNVSHEVTILSISLFVTGLGIGPLLVGPLSEVYGRNIIYRLSYAFFFIFSWPIAFAPGIGKHRAISLCISQIDVRSLAVILVFRFITGFCGSAFLSVAGGSVSDLFSSATVAT